ncbi:MAG: thioredoxin [Candidatus Komeilibacteria bacterium]|nr:thioredoxin [Candidatus Komeilibacteria bacterium]
MSEIIFTDQNFEQEVFKNPGVALVDFYASWCGPCKIQGPIVEQLAVEYVGKAKIGKLDVDANNQIASQFQVMSIPTIIIFKNGQPKERLVGLQATEKLRAKLDELL